MILSAIGNKLKTYNTQQNNTQPTAPRPTTTSMMRRAKTKRGGGGTLGAINQGMNRLNNVRTGVGGVRVSPNMDEFNKRFDEYGTRMESMEKMLAEQGKMYEGFMNKMNYNDSQAMPNVIQPVAPQVQPQAPQVGQDIGYRQGDMDMNNALLRYMQNLWGGGF